MRIVFFVTSLNVGGIENYLLRFLHYSKNSIKPIIVCKSGIIGSLKEKYAEIPDIEFIVINVGYFNLIALCKIYKILKSQSINSVCDFTGDFSGFIMLVSKLAGVKKRITFYRGSTNHFKEDFFRIFYAKFVRCLVYNFSTNILFNSKAAQLFFFKNNNFKKRNKFNVIYNGINVSQFKAQNKSLSRDDINVPKTAFVVGHSGRYDKAKNHETIIKVASLVCVKHPNVFFVLCGEGIKENLSEEVKSKGLDKNIVLLGYREDVNSILSLCDMFFFPSITEGQPNSLIEAMAMELPFLASNIEPIKETVPEDLISKLINPYDINSFAEQIEKIYLKPENAFQFKADSDWIKKKYDPNKQFNEFLQKLI